MIIEMENGYPTERGKAQLGREIIDFDNPDFCAKCGKRNGDHAYRNKFACQFVPKNKNK